jgi:XTP/dITP diphosphohydrolase
MQKIKTDIVVATKNKGKVAEIEKFLGGLELNILSLADFAAVPDAPETGSTFLENAKEKALYYAGHTGKLCLADDSGLLVDALGGEPGIYSARYAGEGASDSDNNRKLLEKLKPLAPGTFSARFWCSLALADASGVLATAEGAVEGVILSEPRGAGGFGYDPLFLLTDGSEKTLAELSSDAKNKISHRGAALEKLAAHSVWGKIKWKMENGKLKMENCF